MFCMMYKTRFTGSGQVMAWKYEVNLIIKISGSKLINLPKLIRLRNAY